MIFLKKHGNNINRAHWGSNIGFILSAAGSAVGLGNIWKFPRVAYNNGGGLFIIIYLLITLFIGCTVMMCEFVVGRHTHTNCIGAFRRLSRRWAVVGWLGIISGFVILAYYIQVSGWVFRYAVSYLINPAKIFSDPAAFLTEHTLGATNFPFLAGIIFPALIMTITVFIVTRGISSGIEKANKILMPLLLLILILLLIRGLTLPGTGKAVSFLTSIDLEKIDSRMIIAALGQAFFSLSLGMGVMCTYASYLPDNKDLVKNTFTICGLDAAVALISGFAIIPLAISAGQEIPGGANSAGFGFISMATVFQSMPFGRTLGFLFYSLILFAAITSSISILEGLTAFFVEEKKLNRKKTAAILGGIIYILGIPYTLSQEHLNIRLPWLSASGVTYPLVGEWMEYLTDRLLMPLGALMFCIFVGYVWGIDRASAEIEKGGRAFRLRPVFSFCTKYLAPAAIIIILLQSFGVF